MPPSSAVIAIKSKPTNNTPQSQSRSQSSTPSPSSSPPKDAAYLKRREQVRRAQRTHRERKENYIKALEEQVLDLRTKQREIVRENEALTTEVVQLRELVKSDGTSENSNYDSGNAWMLGGQADGNANAWGGNEMWQHVNLCTVGDANSSEAWSWQSGAGCGVPVSWSGHTASSSTALTLATHTRRPTPSRISELDCTDLAVEFVMTLEKPCINRATSTVLDLGERSVDYALQAPSTGTYHTFLEDNVLKGKQKASNANASLDKLLALSKDFKLVGEVTPIQAWQQIVSHPQFCSIGLETMRRLVEQLLWHVKCYGFGAVIDMSIFKELFKSVFVA
ncbi:hypothetical protein IQ06DRAFT_337601 [Phaeosphaeriaceae sp. SRC1lsM3a]|nr:hypothetical protein IQ06DRAFT_337601 [Stagonospora sp. SRC1lsM3a]